MMISAFLVFLGSTIFHLLRKVQRKHIADFKRYWEGHQNQNQIPKPKPTKHQKQNQIPKPTKPKPTKTQTNQNQTPKAKPNTKTNQNPNQPNTKHQKQTPKPNTKSNQNQTQNLSYHSAGKRQVELLDGNGATVPLRRQRERFCYPKASEKKSWS